MTATLTTAMTSTTKAAGSTFDDLDDAECSDDEDCDTAICSNAVDHSMVTLPRPASSMPASLAAVPIVFLPQEEGVTSEGFGVSIKDMIRKGLISSGRAR